jgi:nucleoside-diphosphate-sugar epimerase
VHAAGHFRFWGPDEIFERVNLRGTRNVADGAAAAKVERMVHISTIAVVGGAAPGHLIDEKIVCMPQDAYQRTKLKGEGYVLNMARERDLPALILRPGAFYGPYGHYAFNRLFIQEPLMGWRIKVDGGKRYTFPVYVPDVARMILNSLTLGRVGEVYNVSDRSITHNELNDMVSEMLGISPWRWNAPQAGMIAFAILQEGIAKIIGHEPFYPLNLRHYVYNDWQVSSEKARDELGFEPTPIRDGLQQTVKWYLKERKKRERRNG